MLDESRLSGVAVVLGAGTMGGGIAADLANAGWDVRLLDVASDDTDRSRVARAGWERLRTARPLHLFLPEWADRIRVGNTADHLEWIAEADWVVEAVAERMGVKREVFSQVERYAGPETVVSTNTSGLSLRAMTEGRGEAFRRRFLGTHFLNPPRYTKLLEVIPLPETDPAVTEGFSRFSEQILGHRVVVARDTPGFISTRIGIWHLMDTVHQAMERGMPVEEVDALTGPLLGRPRSATFRLADLIGLDILAGISRNQRESLPDNPLEARIALPDVMERLIAAGRLGEKTGSGFYRREGGAILALDLETLQYRPKREVDAAEWAVLKVLPLADRLCEIRGRSGSAGFAFLNGILDSLEEYVQHVGPEIAEDALAVDRAMRWGFGWELGPFEMIDARHRLPPEMAFRDRVGPVRRTRVFGNGMRVVPQDPQFVCLADLKDAGQTVIDAPEASLIDLGDGVFCIEYHTKMNTFGPGLCAFIFEACDRAEREARALVLGNQAPHFSAGYDLNLFLEAAEAGRWSEIDRMLREVQDAFLRLKYATVPVVAAPHGYTLGAGCEGTLYVDAVQAARELAIGLPEQAVGVIPAGGGTTAMLFRVMADGEREADPYPRVENLLRRLAFPKTSDNAYEARAVGFLRSEDGISPNPDRLLSDAKRQALSLSVGYAPTEPRCVRVLGTGGLARLRMTLYETLRSGAMTEHDFRIADRIAFVLSGGDLPAPYDAEERYLHRLEREVFVDLMHEPLSRERMRHVLETGKPIRN